MTGSYKIPVLPPLGVSETPKVLRALVGAHRQLAELKGHARTIPNQGILINTLGLQEAKASSEIENIVTTQDEVFRIEPSPTLYDSPSQKEVAAYQAALQNGFEGMQNLKGIISGNTIVGMFQVLKNTTGEFRKTPGTALLNERTGEVVYTPPQAADEIVRHMRSLELFINDDNSVLDPLVRMAVIHHQFESIHPFPDGNGRIGRIINVLFMVREGLLDVPILYLSRYITATKDDYYRLLQATRDYGSWEEWLLYIITGVEQTAAHTIRLISEIRQLMAEFKERLRTDFRSIYSQDLLNNLFRHPYTRIEYVMSELSVSRPTATRYLGALANGGVLTRIESGRKVYFVNAPLVALFAKD
jgi:Fic family protein